MKKILFQISAICMLAILFSSCEKEEPEIIITEPTDTTVSDSTIVVNKWIWSVLNDIYLWRDNLPIGIDYTKESNPSDYFDKLIYHEEDRWSVLISETDELDKWLSNENKSFGFSFQLYLKNTGEDDVIGIVEYVAKDSPAERAGLKRGDIFYSINNLDINTTNYQSLLSSDTYVLKFLEMENDTYTEINGSLSISAIEFKEDPLLLSKVIEVSGKKIGYLSYTGFIYSEEDSANLVNTFQFFKDENISDLVLDFRYNGGGSAYIAKMIASMIAPESAVSSHDVFYRYIWNDNYNTIFLQQQGANSGNLVAKFIDVPVNLNLNNLYALTLPGTASASELVIHGLNPYMNNPITLIGDTTHGKYTVSIPFDDEENGYRHNYAMLPIVAKYANKIGITDFADGLPADFIIRDDYFHELGHPDEALLQKAISLITGIEVEKPSYSSMNKSKKLVPIKTKGLRKKPLDGLLIDRKIR